MPTYIVESYSAGGVVPQQRERAQRVAKTRAGIQYVRTTFLPGDETLLHLFEATSADVLREAVIVAGLECDRIVEAVEASAQADEGEWIDPANAHASRLSFGEPGRDRRRFRTRGGTG